MTQLTALIAIGTAATVLAIVLLLVRAEFHGRRPVLALTRRWVAAGNRTSGLVLALLSAIAISSFAGLPARELRGASSASALSGSEIAPSMQATASLTDESSPDAKALQALRAYAGKIDAKAQSKAAMPAAAEAAALPDVDTMIAKLHARLEKQPEDVKGWKMLGWAYLNMDRTEEAAKAYETALKLDPDDIEIMKGLETAKSVKTAATQTPAFGPSHPVTSPTPQDSKGAEGQSAAQTDSMIRGMVDQLAARLETAPKDEEGWLRLMRSRMTLGEKEAAKAALTKALETFASDAEAKARLTAAARDLGVGSN